jgi:Na+-driven multidrug efflux pump
MRAFIWGIPFLGVQMTMMVTFQSLGKSIEATIVTLGRQCIFYIPSLYLLNHFFGFNGFIYAQPIADTVTALIAAVFGIPIFKEWKRIAVIRQNSNKVN